MESRSSRVNESKTKVMMSSVDSVPVSRSGVQPCAVCKRGVGGNSILCIVCGD